MLGFAEAAGAHFRATPAMLGSGWLDGDFSTLAATFGVSVGVWGISAGLTISRVGIGVVGVSGRGSDWGFRRARSGV